MLECTVVTWIKTKVCYIGYCDCKYYTYGESILNWNVLLLYCWSQTNEIYGGKKLDEKPIMPTNNPCQHGLSLRGEGQGVQLPPGISKSLMKVGLLEKNTRMLKISLSILWFQGLKTWKIVYKGSFFPPNFPGRSPDPRSRCVLTRVSHPAEWTIFHPQDKPL